jgi:hypothetical protein
MSMEMTERRSYKELWVVAGILLAVILIAQLPSFSSSRGSDDARLVAMMGSARRVVASSENLRAADVTVVMGNVRLDLREAALPPGEEIVVDVLTVMGAFTLRVPEGWVVDTSAIPVVGGVKDSRLIRLEDPPSFDGKPAPRIVLHGAVLLGGIRITS